MNQPRYKTPRGQKTMPVNTVAASVQQAIQRDPLQSLPGEEAALRQHPVMRAIDLLINYDGEELFEPDSFNEAGRQLQEYHAEQMAALQQASGRAEESNRQLSEFVERVAGMMDIDLIDADMNAQDLMEVLADRLNPPQPLTVDLENLPKDFDDGCWHRLQQDAEKPPVTPNEHAAIKNMHAVCTVLAKHFGDDPAVTFENAAGLAQQIIDACDKMHATAQQQTRELREYIDPNALRLLVSDFGGGLVDNPLEVLREILTNLQKNQIPDGFKEHAQTLVDTNQRYENVLATMRNVLSLV